MFCTPVPESLTASILKPFSTCFTTCSLCVYITIPFQKDYVFLKADDFNSYFILDFVVALVGPSVVFARDKGVLTLPKVV